MARYFTYAAACARAGKAVMGEDALAAFVAKLFSEQTKRATHLTRKDIYFILGRIDAPASILSKELSSARGGVGKERIERIFRLAEAEAARAKAAQAEAARAEAARAHAAETAQAEAARAEAAQVARAEASLVRAAEAAQADATVVARADEVPTATATPAATTPAAATPAATTPAAATPAGGPPSDPRTEAVPELSIAGTILPNDAARMGEPSGDAALPDSPPTDAAPSGSQPAGEALSTDAAPPAVAHFVDLAGPGTAAIPAAMMIAPEGPDKNTWPAPCPAPDELTENHNSREEFDWGPVDKLLKRLKRFSRLHKRSGAPPEQLRHAERRTVESIDRLCAP